MRKAEENETWRFPFLIWGKYRVTLPVSFQFHHTQLDGIPAAEFLERLQREIQKRELSP